MSVAPDIRNTTYELFVVMQSRLLQKPQQSDFLCVPILWTAFQDPSHIERPDLLRIANLLFMQQASGEGIHGPQVARWDFLRINSPLLGISKCLVVLSANDCIVSG